MSQLFLYPGAKQASKLEVRIALLKACGFERSMPLREPFAGSGGITLFALKHNFATGYWLNDIDVSIASLWQAVLNYPSSLCRRIENFKPSVEAFHSAKNYLQFHTAMPDEPADLVELAFQRIVMSRLSHCAFGVFSGGPRGGHFQDGKPYFQNGRWRVNRIDSRWSVGHMKRNINDTSRMLRESNARCTNLDYSHVIRDDTEKGILFLDPPYVGAGLYRHKFTEADHHRLASLLKVSRHPFVMTYGDHPLVHKLYAGWTTIRTVALVNHMLKKTKGTNRNRVEPRLRTDLVISRS